MRRVGFWKAGENLVQEFAYGKDKLVICSDCGFRSAISEWRLEWWPVGYIYSMTCPSCKGFGKQEEPHD